MSNNSLTEWEVNVIKLSENVHAIGKIVERLETNIDALANKYTNLSDSHIAFKSKILVVWTAFGLMIFSGLGYGLQQITKIPVLENRIANLESKK